MMKYLDNLDNQSLSVGYKRLPADGTSLASTFIYSRYQACFGVLNVYFHAFTLIFLLADHFE
jgi:hypothetical protein